MRYLRNVLPLVAAALFTLVSLGGCKSNTQQSANQPAGTPGTQSPQSAQQPAGASGQAPAPGSSQGAPAAAPQAPPQPATIDLPAGTQLRVRLDDDLGSKISNPGDSFSATVADDVVVNGQTVIARGSRADGTVIDAKPLGHFKGGAFLAVRLDRVHTQWGSYPVETSSIDRAEKGKGKRSTVLIGGGAGLGALIGGLAGGGKGAAIGALAGSGAGTAGSAFTGNHQIVLPAETLLTFRLENPVHITEQR
jgi:hypothetical protein